MRSCARAWRFTAPESEPHRLRLPPSDGFRLSDEASVVSLPLRPQQLGRNNKQSASVPVPCTINGDTSLSHPPVNPVSACCSSLKNQSRSLSRLSWFQTLFPVNSNFFHQPMRFHLILRHLLRTGHASFFGPPLSPHYKVWKFR